MFYVRSRTADFLIFLVIIAVVASWEGVNRTRRRPWSKWFWGCVFLVLLTTVAVFTKHS
jgi:drug/metabolite transporter (DMT)-like permease